MNICLALSNDFTLNFILNVEIIFYFKFKFFIYIIITFILYYLDTNWLFLNWKNIYV